MRQKYIISINDKTNMLNIKEYAIINSIPKNVTTLTLKTAKYSLLGEETYGQKDIMQSISKGKNSLVAALRTKNFFPIGPYALKIAETVMELYKSPNEDPVELFFDDVELLPSSE